MLELTRRITPARNHFVRLAGAYMDEGGFVDGTFNILFSKLKGGERDLCLNIAKTVPFAETNTTLKAYRIPGFKPGSIWQLLYAMRDSELKNDALLLSFYEYIGERFPAHQDYAIYVYYGVYDIPVKASDKECLEDSEEIYSYLIVTISETDNEQTPNLPKQGLIFPAFTERSQDMAHVLIYDTEENIMRKMLELVNEL